MKYIIRYIETVEKTVEAESRVEALEKAPWGYETIEDYSRVEIEEKRA